TIFRQKRLVGTLVLGPFLILLLFGVGFKGGQVPIRTIVVVPGGLAAQEVDRYRQAFGTGTFQIADVTQDLNAARAQRDRHQVRADVEGGNAAAAQGVASQMRGDTSLARALTGGALASLQTAGQSLGAKAAADVASRVTGELDRVDADLNALAAGSNDPNVQR